ncbi:hypothetical protein ANCCAN_22444 [Ancylostoma caninum]|uniref:Uncharacterized protein n=1 Tax=Ancylostoma caninum TaxID=29170 RepID=A0A368FLS6_ANCCA|nr:hypothetical protein ANCCAN_22444 [Ancylostoma caninum]
MDELALFRGDTVVLKVYSRPVEVDQISPVLE